MRLRVVLAAVGLMALMGVSALAGGIALRSSFASAGTGQATTPPEQATTPAPSTQPNQNQDQNKNQGPNGGFRHGGGGMGMGGWGMGPGMGMGMGRGGWGFGGRGDGGLTDQGATNAISNTTQYIATVRTDLDYAKGKMDTTQVDDWLQRAATLVTAAQTANTAQNYGGATANAQAARDLASAADLVMAQALGADKLPSYTNRPQGRGGNGGPPMMHNGTGTGNTAAPSQVMVSRELVGFYNSIISAGAVARNAGATSDTTGYITLAQNQYKTAYQAYQAGKYTDASNAAQVGQALLRVAGDLLRVSIAPPNATTPLTVPAPNF